MKTIYEIAREAKVSIATVSRAVNPRTRAKIASATLERVDRVIGKYQYAPSLAAKGLTHSIFYTIGVVVPHGPGFFENEYYLKILSGISDAFLESRYRFKIIMLKGRDRKWDGYPFRSAEGVDALILTHWRVFFERRESIGKIGVPCLILGDPEEGVPALLVSADQKAGGALAGKYLAGKGHRRVAVMAGSKGSLDSELRIRGFKEALRENKITLSEKDVLFGDFQEGPAYEAALEYLKKKPNVTAMFCANDTMAYGVLRAMKELKMRCPEDLSMIGFDDDSRAATAHPPLTTLHVPLYEIAEAGTRKLLERLNSSQKQKKPEVSETLFPAALVERSSVCSRL